MHHRYFGRVGVIILLGLFLLPFAAAPRAEAALAARDVLIKASGQGATVYYLAADGKRYVFPNEKTYLSWFSGYSAVQTVSPADLMSWPLGGNVTYRPGVRLVKITTDPKVYAVAKGGVLRWITDEFTASRLYGVNWNQQVDDVPDAFFVNYSIGAPIAAPSEFSPAVETAQALSINADLGIAGGSGAPVSDTWPGVNGPAVANCQPGDGWTCSAWSACGADGVQTRTCGITYGCVAVTDPKPQESLSCIVAQAPSYTSGGGASVSSVPLDALTQAGSVVGGSAQILAKFKFTAQFEDLKITKLSFAVAAPAAVTALSLYEGGQLVGGPANVDGAGNAFFSNLSVIVPRNASETLAVSGAMNSVGPSGALTGSNALITLKDTAGPYSFEVRGASLGSSTLITALPNGDQAGNDKILRKTVPTVSLAPLPNSVLTGGTVVASRFTVSADPAGDVAVKTFTLDVQKPLGVGLAPSGDSSHTAVRRVGSSEGLIGHSSASAGCAAGAGTDCIIRSMIDTEEDVAAGSSQTYDIRLEVSGPLAVGDSLSSVLLGDDTLLTGVLSPGSAADQAAVAGTDVNFAWSDQSAIPHSPSSPGSSADWASGRYVQSLPTDSQALSK